jgi:hypothetical protein
MAIAITIIRLVSIVATLDFCAEDVWYRSECVLLVT